MAESGLACLPEGRWFSLARVSLEGVSVADDFSNGLVGDPHVGAEFLYGEELVFGFVEGGLDFQDQVAAVAFTFAGDELDVFGIDADAGSSWFHRCSFLC
ncbi:hypothetical protein ACM44_13675 [Chryseobacterium koreense CCUG 49689]|uniref:Uncharacterized protein n=1 Tax=Chryseobacterium koreense CCUG 49689 TaxID=1304281 RepID=A0A0J7IWL3_9FLAO|nr:hypothetical protein ACM44_13675 [Chryseobacterium koreense CCUG 49689]